MTALDYATTHRTALLEIGWDCGPVTVSPDGTAGFTAVRTARAVGVGRRAKPVPTVHQRRTFDGGGTLTVERMQPCSHA